MYLAVIEAECLRNRTSLWYLEYLKKERKTASSLLLISDKCGIFSFLTNPISVDKERIAYTM